MSRAPVPIGRELRDTIILAAPIVLNQVGHMMMGVVDTMVAGRISTAALAGLGLAANFFWTFISICLGCLFSLDTFFAQSLGARDDRSLARYLGQSWWACGLLALLSGLGVVLGTLVYMGFTSPSPERSAFLTYIYVVLWSVPSVFIFFVLQRYWQARHRVIPFTLIIAGGNVLNLVASLGLALGLWGLPRLEVQGLAWATVVSRYVMLVPAILFTLHNLKSEGLRLPWVEWQAQKEIFTLGVPAAGHTALEIGAFTIATFVVGALGAVPLAAHNVCLIMAAFTFMFPYGFSQAAAVRVGHFVGSGEPERARVAGWLCIAVSITVMSGFAFVYWFLPGWLLAFFTKDPAVIAVGAQILVLVALFQIADGLQVSTTGALRGAGNTRAAMIANLIGHYPVGLALGLLFCFGLGWGVLGVWVGLAAGLVTVGTLVLRAWTLLSRQPALFKTIVVTPNPPRFET